MSWVADLASGFGLPAGAATIATAIYGACLAVEKAARPEVIQDIGRFLQNPSWTAALQPSTIVSGMFKATFGDRHLSLKCLTRSIVATFVVVLATIVAITLKNREIPYILFTKLFLYEIVSIGILSDYIALWKTRVLLAAGLAPIFVIVLDICASLAISSVLFVLFDMVYLQVLYNGSILAAFNTAKIALLSNILLITEISESFYYPPIFFRSTLLTSMWTILIFLSLVVLRMLTPIQRFTMRLFDVEKRPFEAIGLIASGLTMIVSLASSVARAALWPP